MNPFLLPVFALALLSTADAQTPPPTAPAAPIPDTQSGSSIPRRALPLETKEWPRNYRLHLEGESKLWLHPDLPITLSKDGPHDLAIEHPAEGPPLLRLWTRRKLVRGPEEVPLLAQFSPLVFPEAGFDFGKDFTALVSFTATGDGTLFSICAPEGKWSPGAKALFLRGGQLVYDIGWLGAMSGDKPVNDGKTHTAVLSVSDGMAKMWVDGKLLTQKPGFTKPDQPGHQFKIGQAAPDFAGNLTNGRINQIHVWKRALTDPDIRQLFKNNGTGANTPDFAYAPEAHGRPRLETGRGWVQALERSDHADIVASWNNESLAEGEKIYKSLCTVCHGTKDQPGSLPTALRFAEGAFKNGSDPYSMYDTLTHGFGQMVPQPQYTTAQKYAVIQYIRETFLRPYNPSQYTETPAYFLPRGLARAEAEKEDTSLPPWQQMELGHSLFWTLEVEPGNIAQKGIAVRVDNGPGGVTRSKAWMIYDHDTMRLAAAGTGALLDWKGIAFDGSHGTHTAVAGDRHFVNPPEPGWTTTNFLDARIPARDGKKYGPVPGLRFLGLYTHNNTAVLAMEVNGTRVLESPSLLEYGSTPVFVRTLNIGKTATPLVLRVAPDHVSVHLQGSGELTKESGFWIARLPGGANSRLFISRADAGSLTTLSNTITTSADLSFLTKGGPPLWNQKTTSTSVAGSSDSAFIADDFPFPAVNPWQSWMRPGGFDFTPDGQGAIVAMWNGDVWRVDGIMKPAPAELTWRRIASGLFQPLGVKFRGQELFITCRDQIAKLTDLNADGETDFIECFNDDAQVTEHFHEFAMGLQTDAAGNFYYAKSGRHALDSVVQQHGTLLKVSADGRHTEILATGFRAANGVCVNDDGTFFVTDQEGFWTPKNRINHVKPGGFYGNMFGYTSVTDTSDSAMEPPMVWITNEMDRSPAELVRIPDHAWGKLGGSLLNLSYGTGRAFIVPHEEVGGVWQGAVCELPMPAFATGIMRGRFGQDGALYTCGMFAWAGNATTPGGFHRIRPGTQPAQVPLAVHASKDTMTIRFSDPIQDTTAAFKIWSLKRSANYGSKHLNERTLPIQSVQLSADQCTVTLTIPSLAPTDCYELRLGNRILHGTINKLASP